MAIVDRFFVTDYGAPTNGTSDASPALNSWLADALTIIAGGDTPRLNMQGHSYHFAGSNGPTNGLTNAIINGQSSSVDALFIGNAGVVSEDFAHSARIGSVTAGATSATIIQGPYPNDVQTSAAFLSVGQWVMFTGVGLQTGSYPPSSEYVEFRKIATIVGNTITWAQPLRFAYSQTWPLVDTTPVTVSVGANALVSWAKHGFSANQTVIFKHDVGGAVPGGVTDGQTYYVIASGLTTNAFEFSATQGGAAVTTSSAGTSVIAHTQATDLAGPATIYGLLAAFDGAHQYQDLTCTSGGAVFGGGSVSMTLTNLTFTGLGPAPSAAQSYVLQNSQVGSQNEVDKCVEYLEYNNCTGTGIKQLFVQSAGVVTLAIKNGCNFTALNGTPYDTSVDSSTIGTFIAGAVGYGRSNSIAISNSTISAAQDGSIALDLTAFTDWTFLAGVFTIPLTSGVTRNAASQALVAGFKYVVGYYDGARHTVDDLGGTTVFKVTDEWQDSANVYYNTTLSSAIFNTFLGGNAANRLFSYGARTITQVNSGPADVTQFAQPPDPVVLSSADVAGFANTEW